MTIKSVLLAILVVQTILYAYTLLVHSKEDLKVIRQQLNLLIAWALYYFY